MNQLERIIQAGPAAYDADGYTTLKVTEPEVALLAEAMDLLYERDRRNRVTAWRTLRIRVLRSFLHRKAGK